MSDPLEDVLSDVESARTRERLAEVLDLGSVGRQIKRVRVHGRGGRAQVRIDLDNGEWIEFDPLGSYSAPAKMNFEVSAQVGSSPTLKKPGDVQEVATLIFWLGDHYEAIATADRAWELGAEYPRDAVLVDVDMAGQGSRWESFEYLDGNEAKHRRNVVLHDSKTGSRYVRTQWLTEYLRGRSDTGEAGAMKGQLERHGWKKAGKEGRIKATHPSVPTTRPLIWAFLIVPKDWENQDPEPEAGDGR